MNVESFNGTRVWVQRVSDSRIFAGWIVDVERNGVILKLGNTQSLSPGDELSFQALGTATCATFRGRVAIISGDQLSIVLEGQPRYTKSVEEARTRVEGVFAHIQDEFAPVEAEIVDISSNGLGMIVGVPLEKGAHIQVSVESPFGPIACSGEVRYCRQVCEEPMKFRVGLHLASLDRVNKARWHRMIDSIAA